MDVSSPLAVLSFNSSANNTFIKGESISESSVEALTPTLSKKEPQVINTLDTVLMKSILENENKLRHREPIIAGSRKLNRSSHKVDLLSSSTQNFPDSTSELSPLNSISEEPINLSFKNGTTSAKNLSELNAFLAPKDAIDLSLKEANSYDSSFTTIPVKTSTDNTLLEIRKPDDPNKSNVNLLNFSNHSFPEKNRGNLDSSISRKRKIPEENNDDSESEPLFIEDNLVSGNLSWLFNDSNSAVDAPESNPAQTELEIDYENLSQYLPNIASTPRKTPMKKRRRSCFANPVPASPDSTCLSESAVTRSLKRRTKSTLIKSTTAKSNTPKKALSAENLRPFRQAKNIANKKNEKIFTTVVDDTESSLEETTSSAGNDTMDTSCEQAKAPSEPPDGFRRA